MKLLKITLLLLSTIILMSCSDKAKDHKPKGVLSDAQQQTLDNAKKTEEILQNVDKERLTKLDETAGQ